MDEAGRDYDDVDFINKLITEATTNNLLGTPIDPHQVYLVGESRGAGFAYFLIRRPAHQQQDTRDRAHIRHVLLRGRYPKSRHARKPASSWQRHDHVAMPALMAGGRPKRRCLARRRSRATPISSMSTGSSRQQGTEFGETAPPKLDEDWASTTWSGWADAGGCYIVRVSSETEQTLDQTIGGKAVKTYAYSQSAANLATRCAGLDLTFYIVQGGGHVPGGFQPTAWCFLSTVGGKPEQQRLRIHSQSRQARASAA